MAKSISRRFQPAGPPRLPLKTRGLVITGSLCILFALGGFGVWSIMTPIASAVIATGSVMVDSNRKAVQHLEGGAVKEILVRDGSRVVQGETLIRLDETRARASLLILQGGYDAAVALRARLIAEREGHYGVSFPETLLKRRDDPDVKAVVDGQRNLFIARQRAREGQMGILEQRVAQYGEQIVGLVSQKEAKEAQVKLINEELRALLKLLKKGHTTKPRILALQREAAQLSGARGEHIAAIARAKTAIGETRLTMLQLEKKLREEVVAELREVDAKIYDVAERLNAARHVLNHIDIKAPVSGVVVGLDVHTVGGIIRAGDTILQIVPGGDRLIVEARVQPIDIDSIAKNLEADVHLTAFKQRSSFAVTGKVSYVSADSMVDKQSGQPYFLARIEVSDDQLKLLGGKKLQPGMPADVVIKTGSRTAIRYLVQPIIDSMNRAWREE